MEFVRFSGEKRFTRAFGYGGESVCGSLYMKAFSLGFNFSKFHIQSSRGWGFFEISKAHFSIIILRTMHLDDGWEK